MHFQRNQPVAVQYTLVELDFVIKLAKEIIILSF